MSPFLRAEGVLEAATLTHPGQTLLLFAGHDSCPQLPPLLAEIQSLGVPCLGGVFPEVISGIHRSSTGFVAAVLDSYASPVLLVDGALESLAPTLSTPSDDQIQRDRTLMVLADVDNIDVATVLKRLHRRFGNRYRYIGGGAGAQDGTSIPCVFTAEQGLHAGAVALGFFRGSSSIHASHGWHRAIGPAVATKTSGNIINELNWRPAYEVYRELIHQSTQVDIESLPFVEAGLMYPLGMIKEDAEDLVRVPLQVTADGGMTIIGGVPAHSVLHVLAGVHEDLISASADSARHCATSFGRAARHKVLFDCVTRPSFLKARYVAELEAIQQGLLPLGPSDPIGVLARGEVCGMAGGIPEWLNKTTVIGVFA